MFSRAESVYSFSEKRDDFIKESTIERYFTSKVKEKKGLALKLVSPSMVGLPDRMILLPRGQIFFVELKATGKKARLLQEAVHRKLRNLGFAVYVIDSKEKGEEVLKKYGL